MINSQVYCFFETRCMFTSLDDIVQGRFTTTESAIDAHLSRVSVLSAFSWLWHWLSVITADLPVPRVVTTESYSQLGYFNPSLLITFQSGLTENAAPAPLT